MRVTFFRDKTAKTLVVRDLSVQDLADEIKSAAAKSKTALPWLKLAVFGDKRSGGGSLRNNANVLSLSGIEGDYDAEMMSIEDGAALFERLGIEAILYSTPSSAPGKPRWRALTFFSKELPPSKRNRLVEQFNDLTGNIFSWESRTLSQSFYYGWVQGCAQMVVRIVEGRKVDLVLDNPFLEYEVESSGLDVNGMLERMTLEAGRGDGVHVTCLRCSASLLGQGYDAEATLEKILPHVRRAYEEAGRPWDERASRQKIERMCEDFLAKVESEESAADPGTGNIESIGPAQGKKIGKKELHIHLAAIFQQALRNRGEGLLRLDEEWHVCRGGTWQPRSTRAGDEWVESEIGKLMKLAKIVPTQRAIREVLAEVKRTTARDSVSWDAHGCVPVRNGMLDPKTLQLRPVAAEDYATWQIPVAYDPRARCPTWLKMLAERFSPEISAVVQECAGAGLLPNRNKDQRRILIQVGGSNKGKSAVLDVLCGLFSDTCISTDLNDIEGPHGTMQFRSKRAPWRLDEAFDQGRWHPTATLKAIVSGDEFRINVKNGPMLTVSWDGPCFWATNAPVQFREQSKAIENRIIIIECEVEFDPRSPTGAAVDARDRKFSSPAELVLASEMSGVLNWALEGMRRIDDRGSYDLPDQLSESLEDFGRDTNVLASFFEECVEFDPDARVCTVDFHYAFASYVRDDMRSVPSAKTLGRWLKSMGDNRVGHDHKRTRSGNRKFYVGVRLNSHGLDHWSSRQGELAARGNYVPGASESADEVNSQIPSNWRDFDVVKRIKKYSKKPK